VLPGIVLKVKSTSETFISVAELLVIIKIYESIFELSNVSS